MGRQAKKVTHSDITHSAEYYSRCVAIISKAKPWQQVLIVKALCYLVGIKGKDLT